MRFEGKVALVTGGSSGIGKAVAERLAREGAKVAVVASSDLAKAEGVAAGIAAGGGEARPFVADVREVASIERLVKSVVDVFGGVDILVNAAGVYHRTAIGETTEADYDRMVDINLKGTFFTINAVAPLMKRQRGGKIVNFASAAAFAGTRFFSLYCAAKAAVVMLTRALAVELAPYDINVNAIAPGNTVSPMNEAIRTRPEHRALLEAMTAATPSNRTYATAEEMAGAVAFLASEEARAMHGATLLLDEGRTAGLFYGARRGS